jgi:hypothetical protein
MEIMKPERFAWLLPDGFDETLPWPYAMIAAKARRGGGYLLPGPWRRVVNDADPSREPVVYYVFPAARDC